MAVSGNLLITVITDKRGIPRTTFLNPYIASVPKTTVKCYNVISQCDLSCLFFPPIFFSFSLFFNPPSLSNIELRESIS